MDPSLLQILTAVIDRIIPADDYPSASEAGVGVYLRRQLTGDAAALAVPIFEGLTKIEQRSQEQFSCGFAEATAEQQDAMLMAIENEPFFQRLVELTAEGFYADPGNGGNLGEISWKMIGYLPREKGDMK